ncbi:MAG: hypothetical protein ACP5C3_07585 [Methanomicrobiales archaeon]
MTRESKISLSNKILILTLLLFALYSIDFLGFSFNSVATIHPGSYLFMALLDTLILSYAILNADKTGWVLILSIFSIFYGLKTFLVGIETAYLTNILSWTLTQILLINGALSAGIFSIMSVILLGRIENSPEILEKSFKEYFNFQNIVNIFGRILISGGVWVLLFIIFGGFVFQNIAYFFNSTLTAQYLHDFGQITPIYVIFFQFIRGILWTVLALPVIYVMGGGIFKKALITGLLFSILMSTNLLIPTILPFNIQFAHFIDVFISNFIFGLILVFIFLFKRSEG